MAANNKNKGMFASAVNAVAGAASGVLETVGLVCKKKIAVFFKPVLVINNERTAVIANKIIVIIILAL